MNVSSILVQTRPEHLEKVLNSVNNYDGCDYHIHDELGRIIVTIEGAGVGEEIEKLKVIQSFKHVVAADMQFAYSEDELNRERDKIEINGTPMPDWLNDNEQKVEDIVYNGDLKKRF